MMPPMRNKPQNDGQYERGEPLEDDVAREEDLKCFEVLAEVVVVDAGAVNRARRENGGRLD